MAQRIRPPRSLATGVGALPHASPPEACADVLAIFPQFPYVPTLPDRGLLESIVFNDSEQMPGRLIRDGRLFYDSETDHTAEMERVYIDYSEGNYAPYRLTRDYASGFIEMTSHRLSGVQSLKCQVTGPVTFGMQVVDAEKRPMYYDEQLADMLSKMIALKARWCEVEMRQKTGVPETLVVLNEPYLASLGSSVVPLDPDVVRSGWNDIAGMVEGGLGIHCCSNTDWEFVIGLEPSVISLDAYTTAREFLLFGDGIASYMERGGVVAWGIVPAEYALFRAETPDRLYERYCEIRMKCSAFMETTLFDAQSLVTPTCGIRFADRTGAVEIMQAAAAISRRIREEMPGV